MQDKSIQLSVENIGPIERKTVEFRFGVNVIQGRNGAGKSTLLRCAESYATGKPMDLSVRDGESVGRVAGPGAELTVRRRCVATGEAEVVLVGGQNNASLVVTGGHFKDAEVRDMTRIRACLNLFGVLTDPSAFAALVGGPEHYDALASKSTKCATDMVEAADRFRRDLQAKARELEAEAERAQQKALALRDSCRDVNTSRPDDKEALAKAVQVAMQAAAKAEADLAAYQRAVAQRKTAEAQLVELQANVPDLAQHTAALAGYDADIRDCDQRIAQLEEQLAMVREERRNALVSKETATKALQAAQKHADAVSSVQRLVEAEMPPAVTQEDVDRCKAEVHVASEHQEYGVIVRRAKAQLAEADHYGKQSAMLATEAERLRNAAKGVDDVLTESLGSCGLPLSWAAGRLTISTDRGPRTLFDELGEGERWVVVALAQAEYQPESFVVIPQECWEAMDPPNRKLVDEAAIARRIVVITGLATEADELDCVPFSGTIEETDTPLA